MGTLQIDEEMRNKLKMDSAKTGITMQVLAKQYIMNGKLDMSLVDNKIKEENNKLKKEIAFLRGGMKKILK
jgi:uncharacterized protein YunC (DUF1805 family)